MTSEYYRSKYNFDEIDKQPLFTQKIYCGKNPTLLTIFAGNGHFNPLKEILIKTGAKIFAEINS